MNQPTQTWKTNVGAVVIDANVLVSICAQEPTCQTAEDALDDYAARNWDFYAPGSHTARLFHPVDLNRPKCRLVELHRARTIAELTASARANT